MKLKFKKQDYQTHAVAAVVDCFNGQPHTTGIRYRIDPGIMKTDETGIYQQNLHEEVGFKNSDLILNDAQLLKNIQKVQKYQNLPQSVTLVKTRISPLNLDIEMETGTGKTYCYIKTIFEMNMRFGWSKFIIVVPSIAIREGVKKTLEITEEHFKESYHKITKNFIYNSKQLYNLEGFSSDAGINIMVINVQAFNARGKDNRRIYEELDDFQSRRPIDVIKANRPILILDEPQKMEGTKTLDSLKEFNPLFILRYSATHKTRHNRIHRLDALDAYNQKLVKKISVRGISVKGLSGTNAYLYLESIEVSKKNPLARLELEVRQQQGIKRIIRKLKKGDNLFELSGHLDQYKGFIISDINAITDTIEFTNGHQLHAGEASGNVNETYLRRIQIREAIKAHLDKEQILYHQGIKVLTLFFIDEVAKYRIYTDDGEAGGEYAKIFEEEYTFALSELKENLFINEDYKKYLDNIPVKHTHNGYFSIDKKGKLIDSKETGPGADKQCNDVDAYDLILKDKERLLSFDEPTRFIFSHSALREGWDNPNVFVICTLKHSDNTISRRQEVGRGLRIAVNQLGERQDNPVTVHNINVLTVVASESYKDFVAALQRDISESLSARSRKANAEFFEGKVIKAASGDVEVTKEMAEGIEFYLIQNSYIDRKKHLTEKYYNDRNADGLPTLPGDLKIYQKQIFDLVDHVYSDAHLPSLDNDRNNKINPLNSNFQKKEFKELWERINRKAVYSVHFNSSELIDKCVTTLNNHLRVTPLQYTIRRGDQAEDISFQQIKDRESFKLQKTSTKYSTHSIHSAVKYDLIGKLVENVQLTRKTVAEILVRIEKSVFTQFKTNPESFITETAKLINEQKASVIIEHLYYDALLDTHDIDIFTDGQIRQDFSKAGEPLKHHIYDYVITDSKTERNFVKELDASSEVVVYAKLPGGFAIPTPVGNYRPDWAISFKEGTVKHIYFVAETKGSMSSLELRAIEKTKIECARKFFKEINSRINPKTVKYDVINNYQKLMDIVDL